MKKIMGSGAGRCGTTWLANIIAAQPNCHCGHQSFRLPVRRESSITPAIAQFEAMLRPTATVSGDVSLMYMSMLPAVLQDDTKLVLMIRRDREAHRASWLKMLYAGHHNPFSDPPGQGFSFGNNVWGQIYPKFGKVSPEEGVDQYLVWCDQRVERISAYLGEQCWVFAIEDASDPAKPEKVHELLDWIGCPVIGRDLSLVGERVNHKTPV